MLLIQQIRLEPILFEFEDVSDLFNLLILDSLELGANLLTHLDGLAAGDVGVLEDVDVGDALLFEIALELM